MTRGEAVRRVIERFKITANRKCVDYDPGAGSTYEYSPLPKDMETLSVLLGREATEEDMFFAINSLSGDRYYLKTDTVEKIVNSLTGAL